MCWSIEIGSLPTPSDWPRSIGNGSDSREEIGIKASGGDPVRGGEDGMPEYVFLPGKYRVPILRVPTYPSSFGVVAGTRSSICVAFSRLATHTRNA